MIDAFVDIAFRGAGKDVKTKDFLAFVILNDQDHSRRYIKILSEDGANSTQSVTDMYNMLVAPRMMAVYPNTFAKADKIKRAETMSEFVTGAGVKVSADTVGTSQRGDVQDAYRPDLVWFNDFETRVTLRSAVKTRFTINLNGVEHNVTFQDQLPNDPQELANLRDTLFTQAHQSKKAGAPMKLHLANPAVMRDSGITAIIEARQVYYLGRAYPDTLFDPVEAGIGRTMKIIIKLAIAAVGFSGGMAIGIQSITPPPYYQSPVAFLYQL